MRISYVIDSLWEVGKYPLDMDIIHLIILTAFI